MLENRTKAPKLACVALAGVLARSGSLDAEVQSEKPSPAAVAQPLTSSLRELTLPTKQLENDEGAGTQAAAVRAASSQNISFPATSEATVSATQNNLVQGYGAAFASLAALVSYGWFYQQLKDGKQPGNLPAALMYTANDTTLLLAALLTPTQGLSTRLVYAVFVGFGVCVSRHLMHTIKQERGAEYDGRVASLWKSFSKLEKWCCIASSLGIAAMAASSLPFVAGYIPQSLLVMFGAGMGVAVNAVASAPLIKTMWARTPKAEVSQGNPSNAKVSFLGRMKETARPVLPYLLGTASLVTGALMVEKFSFEALLSPVGMCVTNIVLTVSVGVWAWRRSKDIDESKSSATESL